MREKPTSRPSPRRTEVSALRIQIRVGDIVKMKKPHPCGNVLFDVLRTGLDIKLRCRKCGHEIMAPRLKIAKSIKSVESAAPQNDSEDENI